LEQGPAAGAGYYDVVARPVAAGGERGP
jgi:hypothetical protein